MFSPAGIDRANQELRDHDTGAVPDFNLTVHVKVEGGPEFVIYVHDGRQFFSLEAGSLSMGAADLTVRLGDDAIRAALMATTSDAAMNVIYSNGSLHVEGDLSKAMFFQQGLVRGAPQDLWQRIANALMS